MTAARLALSASHSPTSTATAADIVSGRYGYRNPGGDMTGKWGASTSSTWTPALDVDGDDLADVIRMSLPDIYWLEATDGSGAAWTAAKSARLRPPGTNSQSHHPAPSSPAADGDRVRDGGRPLLFEFGRTRGGRMASRLDHEDASDEGMISSC
jgi:hypothetical protein